MGVIGVQLAHLSQIIRDFADIGWMLASAVFIFFYLCFFSIWDRPWTYRFTKRLLISGDLLLGYYFVTAQFRNLHKSLNKVDDATLRDILCTSTDISNFADQTSSEHEREICHSWLGFVQSHIPQALPGTAHDTVRRFEAWEKARKGSRIRHTIYCVKALISSMKDAEF